MRKFLASAALVSLALTPVFALPQRGREEPEDRDDRDDRHDRGRHKGWYKHGDHEWKEHRHGDDDDEGRWRVVRAYPRGRYGHVREAFICRTIDYRTRRVILYDRSTWVVAAYDVDHCRDWWWDRDNVYVYDDDHHPGWYLLFNARLGCYVHVQYFGAD